MLGFTDCPIVCIKFGADFCEPCKKIAPLYEKLAQATVGGIACFTVNVEESEDIGKIGFTRSQA